MRPAHHALHRPEPLLRPDDVVGPLAVQGHPADRALYDVDVPDLARADGGEDLVEQQQAFLDAARLHQHEGHPPLGLELEQVLPDVDVDGRELTLRRQAR